MYRRDLVGERRRVLFAYQERVEEMTKIEELRARYSALAHAMQSGVAFTMEKDPKQIELKHLRVGVNVALADLGSLVRLLISKGVFTEEEYMAALVAGMEAEVEAYQAKLREIYGTNTKISLG